MKQLAYVIITSLLCSCASTNGIIRNKSLCNYDYSVAESDKKLDIAKYVIDEEYEDKQSRTITRVAKRLGNKGYLKFITIEDDIYRTLVYNNDLRLIRSYFISNSSYIGMAYDFDDNGNVTEFVDHDAGWNICWQQAMAIAKKKAKYYRCKEKYLTVNRSIVPHYKGRDSVKLWSVHISFGNLKDKVRSVQIYDESGEISGIAEIVPYIEEPLR